LKGYLYSKGSSRTVLREMICNIRHTGLVVRDLEHSLKFYKDLLGFSEWKRAKEEGSFIEQLVGIPGVSLEWAKLKLPDDSLIELLQYHSHPSQQLLENSPSNRLGCSHVALTVDNLDQVYLKLCDNGFHCNSAPLLSPDNNAKVLYCHDPDGIILELVEEL
jgi:catechol 2,3-dioxygenase-like lactoylglutathione lyase family enzyme